MVNHMITTTLCEHGWPVFDQEPCPDCIRKITGAVTAPVTPPSASETIPDFLQRSTDSGKVPDVQHVEAQTPLGSGSPLMDAAPTPLKPGQPGYISQQRGVWTDSDQAAVDKLRIEQDARAKNKVVSRLQKAGFTMPREGEYAEGKHWDQQKVAWV